MVAMVAMVAAIVWIHFYFVVATIFAMVAIAFWVDLEGS